MKGKRGFAFLIATMVLVFVIMSHSRTEAGMKGCYILYVNWNCLKTPDLDYKNWEPVRITLQSNGDIRVRPNEESMDGVKIGTWLLWGNGFFMHTLVDSTETCAPLYSGSTKQGFFECTAKPAGSLYYPGCWYLVKSKKKLLDCPWFYLYEVIQTKADYDTNAVIDLDDEDDD